MLAVRPEHDSLLAAELGPCRRHKRTCTPWLAVQEVKHGHQLTVRLEVREEVVHLRIGYITI